MSIDTVEMAKRFISLQNSIRSYDRPQRYPLGKPELRMPGIPRPDKEFSGWRSCIALPEEVESGPGFPP